MSANSLPAIGRIRIGDGEVRRKKAVMKCKACMLCRARKVRCDGQKPACGFCRSQKETCTFSEDGRQTSRVTKDYLKSIADKIDELESFVRSDGKILSSEQSQQTQKLLPGRDQIPVQSAPGSQTHFQLVPEAVQANNAGFSFPSHVAPIRQTRETSGDESDYHVPSLAAEGSPRGGSVQHDNSPLSVHFVVEDQGGIAVHGPSSSFHLHGSSPHFSDYHSLPMHDALNRDTSLLQTQANADHVARIQMQLIGSAAVERQKESFNLMQRTYDFDGVDYATASHLLDIHWSRHHCLTLLTYRPLIMQDLLASGKYASKLLWNAIFYASSLHSDRRFPDGRELALPSTENPFYQRFKALLSEELERSTIPTVIALLLVASALVSSGRQSPGWIYSGLAYRMILDMGLHLDDSRMTIFAPTLSRTQLSFSPVEQEMRRRVFWGAYVNDKFQSLYFGRPPALPTMGVEPPQVFLDTYEEREMWSRYVDPDTPIPLPISYQPEPTYNVSAFQALLKLAEISSEIIFRFYIPWTSQLSSASAKSYLTNIHKKLQDWWRDLPSHLWFEPGKYQAPPLHRITPHTTFHMLQILLYRPFLPEGHLSHLDLEEPTTREICTSAALKIYEFTKAYKDTFGLRHAPYLSAYALFCAATVLPRQEAQRNIILFFWRALQEFQSGANLNLKKPLLIIRNLMERADIDVVALATASKSRAASPRERHETCPTDEVAPPVNSHDRFTSQLMEAGDLLEEIFDASLDRSQDSMIQMRDSNVLYGMFQQW